MTNQNVDYGKAAGGCLLVLLFLAAFWLFVVVMVKLTMAAFS